MSWHKITLPLSNQIDPKVVQIGKLGWAVYERENKPAGFAMFHATRGSEGSLNDRMLVYLSPVASELCTEIAELFTLEPCDVPARDEPDMSFVYGDPLVMGELKEKFEPEPGTVEWDRAQAEAERVRLEEELKLQLEAAQAEAQAEAEAAQAKAAQADSAQA